MGSLKQEIAIKNILRLNNQTRVWLDVISMPALHLKERVEKELQDNPMLVSSDNFIRSSSSGKDVDSVIENYVADKNRSLFGHLQEQINIAFNNKKDISIAEQIVSFVNKEGYLTMGVVEMSAILGVSESKINELLNIIKTFDPVGVASSSIEECLMRQLDSLEKSEVVDIAKVIVSKYLGYLAKKKYSEIISITNFSKEQIEKAVSLIKTLEPYPAREYDTTDVRYVIPEIFIYKENEKWVVKVENNYIPRLQISKKYIKLVDEARDKESANYFKEKLKQANYLLTAIEDRKKNLLSLGNALLKLQYSFFEFGREYLKPLTLKDIVSFDGVSLSLSSISRLSNSKYVETPYGVFALKYFFSNAVNDYLGSRSVKEMIRRIIANSDKKLSDEKIRLILEESSVYLSRRTVNKYRNSMNIFSSR